MKKVFTVPFFTAVLLWIMAAVQLPGAIAADLLDGTYAVKYEMLQADNNSVSIANDYFVKPATLTIDNGKQFVQFTVNRSDWVKVLTVANGEAFDDVQVVSEDPEKDQRVIAFKVDGAITEPVLMQMHVVIKEMEPAYDHKYSVRLDFDVETMEEIDAPAVVVHASDSESKVDGATGNKVFIYILVAVIVVAIVIVLRRFSSSKK